MKKYILLAIIFALLAAFFAYAYLSDLETRYRNMAEPVKVVVAAKRIPQGVIITKDMLAEKAVPKEYMQPKAFSDAVTLFTKEGTAQYISLNTLEEGEQVMSTKVSKTNTDTGITNIIPDGYKALTVNFDSDSASVITPGSRIDVLSIIEYTDTNNRLQESVFVIAQNILVLACGNNYLGSAKKNDGENSDSPVITLSVTVKEAQSILLAGERGILKYVIRPAGDSDIDDIKPFRISDIVSDISRTVSSNQRDDRLMKSVSQSQKEAMELVNKYSRQ